MTESNKSCPTAQMVLAAWTKFDSDKPPFKSDERVDVIAKTWVAQTDTFIVKRFTDVFYIKLGVITPSNPNPGVRWQGVLEGYRPVYYMPIPELPKID